MKKKVISVIFAVMLSLCVAAVFCGCAAKNDGSNNEENIPGHTHTFSNEWTSDATNHWHAATCGHNVKKDEAAHDFYRNECRVCGYVVTADNLPYNDDDSSKLTFDLINDDENYAVVGCDKDVTTINIPATYKNKEVTTIDGRAFDGCTSLQGIKIPSSVTHINYSFSKLQSLIAVELGDGTVRVCDNCFENCKGLTSIKIPQSAVGIGSMAFYGCESLQEITIPNRITSIGSYAFDSCIKTIFYDGTTEQWDQISKGNYLIGGWYTGKTDELKVQCSDGKYCILRVETDSGISHVEVVNKVTGGMYKVGSDVTIKATTSKGYNFDG